MPRKSIEEQIEATKKQLEIKNNRLKALESKKRTKDRKDRAHRLIQVGAIVEAAYNKDIKEADPNFKKIDGEEMLQALYNFLKDQDTRGGYFSAVLDSANKREAQEAPPAAT